MSRPEANSPTECDSAVLFDQLIPGDGARWPVFSEAVEIPTFLQALDAEQGAVACAWGEALRGLQNPARVVFLKAREADNRARFSELLTAAHRAYYTAPAVLATIQALADTGPREPSPLFDPALVENVLARGAGKRRL